ncbi:MAG: hypothetical protein U0T75_00530 [Chitinophagales bacterium]
MKFVLTLRHWLVFLLLYIVPFAGSLLLIVIAAWRDPDVTQHIELLTGQIMAVATVYIYVSSFFWLYGTGNALHQRLPDTVFMNIHIFRFMTIVPLLWGLWLAYVFYSLLVHMKGNQLPVTTSEDDIFSLGGVMCFLFAIHNNWFIAKALKSIERYGEVSFSDYFGDFILITFLPIGVWLIQPRLNQLANNSSGPVDERPDILDTHFR